MRSPARKPTTAARLRTVATHFTQRHPAPSPTAEHSTPPVPSRVMKHGGATKTTEGENRPRGAIRSCSPASSSTAIENPAPMADATRPTAAAGPPCPPSAAHPHMHSISQPHSTSRCRTQRPGQESGIWGSGNRTWGQDFAWPHTVGFRYGDAAPSPTPAGSECDLREERKPIPIRGPERRGACGRKTDTNVNAWARNRICGQRPEWEQSVKGTGREHAPSRCSQGASPGTEKGPL